MPKYSKEKYLNLHIEVIKPKHHIVNIIFIKDSIYNNIHIYSIKSQKIHEIQKHIFYAFYLNTSFNYIQF